MSSPWSGQQKEKDQSEKPCEVEGEELEVIIEKWGRVSKVFEQKLEKKIEEGFSDKI